MKRRSQKCVRVCVRTEKKRKGFFAVGEEEGMFLHPKRGKEPTFSIVAKSDGELER